MKRDGGTVSGLKLIHDLRINDLCFRIDESLGRLTGDSLLFVMDRFPDQMVTLVQNLQSVPALCILQTTHQYCNMNSLCECPVQ